MSIASSARGNSYGFKADEIDVLRREAARLDRSISWVASWCVRRGLQEVRALPALPPVEKMT